MLVNDISARTGFPFEYIRFEDVLHFCKSRKAAVLSGDCPERTTCTLCKFPAGKATPEEMIIPPNLVDAPVTRRTMADYWSTVDVMDQQVGRILPAS